MSRKEPARKPLMVPAGGNTGGTFTDGMAVLACDDPAYEQAFRLACELHREYGLPMPYAEHYSEETDKGEDGEDDEEEKGPPDEQDPTSREDKREQKDSKAPSAGDRSRTASDGQPGVGDVHVPTTSGAKRPLKDRVKGLVVKLLGKDNTVPSSYSDADFDAAFAELVGDDEGSPAEEEARKRMSDHSGLATESGERVRLFVPVSLAFAEATEWVPYLPRPGVYKHKAWGKIVLTHARLADFAAKFSDGVYQRQLPLDAEHMTKISGAMAWIRELRQNADGSVDARVEWTDRGRSVMAGDRFKYISPEWFDEWIDPLTEKKISNVLIGGALTTRPFFKEQALRPLVASEGGLSDPADNDAPLPIVAGENDTPPPGEETRKTMNDEQLKAFTEMQETLTKLAAENATLRTASEAAATEAKSATEALAAASEANRKLAFAEEVRSGRWVGAVDGHVNVLATLAKTFGEESAELKSYREQQAATAEQVRTAKLFSAMGHRGPGANATSDSPEGRAKSFAEKIRADNPKIDEHTAMAQAYKEHPELYMEYEAERKASGR